VSAEIMNGSNVEKLQDIFRAVFSLPATCDVTQVRQSSEDRWDSLAHVSLVAAIESEFDIVLDAGDTLRMTSYDATRLLLEEIGLP
jgi:acyl carrier protein